MKSIECWFTESLAAVGRGDEMPSLSPIVRELGIAGTVAGLLDESELDNRLNVDILATATGSKVHVQVWSGGKTAQEEMRVLMTWNQLMQRLSEA